jgi:hypothetical protein
MAIVTFIHWRRSYLLSALSICLCGINVIGSLMFTGRSRQVSHLSLNNSAL